MKIFQHGFWSRALKSIMRILDGTESFRSHPQKPLVLALGNFDGIHQGHKRLLDYVVEQAHAVKGQAAVFTFRNHPQQALHPQHAAENLQTLEQKLAMFKECGIEICFLQRFNKKFSVYSAEDFVSKILVKRLGIYEICLGYNARFGRGRAGDADLLKTLGKEFGFKVCQMKPVMHAGLPVSSTAVREAVRQGRMERAAGFLGRPWSIVGRVVRGKAKGRGIGFPTANLQLKDYVQPAQGVYAVGGRVLAHASKKLMPGVLNYGTRPTFEKKKAAVLEAHFLNFNGRLYGKKIEIFFLKHLRQEKKFDSAEALKKQIRKDIQAAGRIFKKQKGL